MSKKLADNCGNEYVIGALYEFSDHMHFSWCHTAKLDEYDCSNGTFTSESGQIYQFCRAATQGLIVGTIRKSTSKLEVGARYLFVYSGTIAAGEYDGDGEFKLQSSGWCSVHDCEFITRLGE